MKLKKLKRPLYLWLAVILIFTSISFSSTAGVPTDKVANIQPRYHVFQGKTLNVFGKTHHSMNFYQVENDPSIVAATFCLEPGKKLWDGTACAFQKYDVEPGKSVPYIGPFDRYLPMVLAYEWMAWEGPYPETIRYGVVQIYYWGCVAGYEDDWDAQEEAMQQFTKVMGKPSVMTYYHDMKDYIIKGVNDYEAGNTSLPLWNGSQQKMKLKDGHYELTLDISSCPKLRSTTWTFPDGNWTYHLSADGNNITFQYNGSQEPTGTITSADIPGVENKYYAYIFNPPAGLQTQMGRLNLDPSPAKVSLKISPDSLPQVPGAELELYRHSETFQSNYNLDLEKYCAETNQPLEGTTFNVWEDFNQSQINQGDYTEGEPDGTTGEVYLNGMSPQPESDHICGTVNTDTNGKARYGSVKYYNYSKTYCKGHPAPDWLEVPEQEADEKTGECTNQGDIDAANAENDRLRQQWMAEQELCKFTCDFHVGNSDENNHEQSTEAMEAMIADRDKTYENFIKLKYGYHMQEKTARTGYILHGGHNDDPEIENVILTSAQGGGSVSSGGHKLRAAWGNVFEPIFTVLLKMEDIRGYTYPVPEGQDMDVVEQRNIVSTMKAIKKKILPEKPIKPIPNEVQETGESSPSLNTRGSGSQRTGDGNSSRDAGGSGSQGMGEGSSSRDAGESGSQGTGEGSSSQDARGSGSQGEGSPSPDAGGSGSQGMGGGSPSRDARGSGSQGAGEGCPSPDAGGAGSQSAGESSPSPDARGTGSQGEGESSPSPDTGKSGSQGTRESSPSPDTESCGLSQGEPAATRINNDRMLLRSSIATGNNASIPDVNGTESKDTDNATDANANKAYEDYQYIRDPVQQPPYDAGITYTESPREQPEVGNAITRFFTFLFATDEVESVTATLPEFMDDDLGGLDASAYGRPGNILYTFKVWNHRTEGRIHMNKRDLELYQADHDGSYGQSQGDGTLEGAVYGLFAAQDLLHPDGKSGVVYNRNDLVSVATTDQKGDASFLAFTEKPGTRLDDDGNIKAPEGVTGPSSLYNGASITSSSEGFGTITYPDNAASGGDQWIGRPLLMGNYYIMELSRSEGYELSVNGINLTESNRTQTGAVTIREAGQARVVSGLSDYNNMDADGSWNEFVVENYKTQDGYDVTVSGYPSGTSFYQVGTENVTRTEQIVTGSSLKPKLDGNGNPVYQTAKGGEYKTDADGNPLIKPGTATGSSAEGRIPYGETLYYRFRAASYPSGSATPGDLGKWGEAVDGDYLAQQVNDMLGQMNYKAVTNRSPWTDLELTGTTNEQAAGEMLDWFTAHPFFDCGTVESIRETGGKLHALLKYDYSAAGEDYRAVYEPASQTLYVRKTADVSGGSAAEVGYWMEYQKGGYSLSSKTVAVKERREISGTVSYGADISSLIQTVYQPVYEAYRPGEVLLDRLGNPIPVLERVPTYTEKAVTIPQEKLDPVVAVYDAATGVYTIHVENSTDWNGTSKAVQTTYRAVTSKKTIVNEGQKMPYNQYLTDIAGAAVSAYASLPAVDAGSYIKTQTLIYPGQNQPTQDGGTQAHPVQVLQRSIKQSIKITKDISQASYDGLNTYGSLHNDPLTVLLGLFHGGGSSQGTKMLNQFKFKAYLKSNLENIYVDEAGAIISQDVGTADFKGDAQKIYLPPKDGGGRRLLETNADGTYNYTKFFDAMNAADRKKGGVYPAEALKQFAVTYYDVDAYKKEALAAEPGLNSDAAYDKALKRAEREASAFLDAFTGLNARLSIAWDQDAGGGADRDPFTLQCNTKSGKDDYYNNSIMLPYGTYVIAEQTPADSGRELANRHYDKDYPKEVSLPFIPDVAIDANTGETEVHDQIGSPFYRYDSKDAPEDLIRKYKIRFNEETSVIQAHGQDGDFEVYKYGLDKEARSGHSLTSTEPYEAEYMDGRNDSVKSYYTGCASQSENAGTADRMVYDGNETHSGQIEVRENVSTMTGMQTAIDGKFASMLVPWTVLAPATDRVNPDTGSVETLAPSGSGKDFNFVAFAQEDFEDVYYSSKLRIEKLDAETGDNIIHDGALFKIYAAKRDVHKNGTNAVAGTGDVLFGGAVDWQGSPVVDADATPILYPRAGEDNESNADLPVRLDQAGIPQYDQSQLIKQEDRDGNETGIFRAYSTVREVVIDQAVQKVPVGYIETYQPLGAGAYILVEVQAPEGYVKSRPVAFEVYSDDVAYYHDKRNPDGTTKGWEQRTAPKYQYAIPVAGETNKFQTEAVSQIPVEDYPSKIEIHKVEDGDSMVGNENALQKTDAQGQTEKSGGFDGNVTVNDKGDHLTYKVHGRKEKLEERGDVRNITFNQSEKEWYGYVTKTLDEFSEHILDGTEKDLKAMPGVKPLYHLDGTFTGKGIRFDVTVSDAELALYQGMELEKTGDHGYKGVEVVRQNGKVMQIRDANTGTHKEIRVTGQDGGPAHLNLWDTVEVENEPVNLYFYDLTATDARTDPDTGELAILDSRGNSICYADSVTGMAYVYDDYGRMIAYPVNKDGEKQLVQSIQVMEHGDSKTIYKDKQTGDDENGLPIYYKNGEVVTKDEHWITDASTDPYGKPETDRAVHAVARLPFGAYILQEERVPYDQGYIQSRYMGIVLKDTEETQKYFLQNDFTKTAFAKIDVRTQKEIMGAAMTLYCAQTDADGNPVREDDGTYRKGDAFAAWTSGYEYDDNGTWKKDAQGQPIPTKGPHWIDHIPVGPYVLEETICPYEQGYVQSASVNIDVKESGSVQSFEMEDDFTSLDIRKFDVKNEDVLYKDSNACLTLYQAMTDNQGNPVVQDGIPQYEESGKIFTFRASTYKDGQDVAATGRVEPDAVSGHGLMKYDYDFQPIPNTYQGRYCCTEAGTTRLEYLPVGNYVLVETENPAGYATADPVLITVRDKGHLEEIQHAKMGDKPFILEVSKVNITGGKEVNGAKLAVYPVDRHGTVSDKPLSLHQPTTEGQYQDIAAAWTSGLDGTYTEEEGKAGLIPEGFEAGDLKPHLIEYIPEGDYILREERTPYGFLQSVDVPFTVTDSQVLQKTEMINGIPEGILKIVKSDTDEPDKKLWGAQFQLVNQTLHQVCETVTTDDQGRARFGPRPIGAMDGNGNFRPYTYVCRETKAAPGHMQTLKPYEFQFEYRNELTDFIILDYSPANASNRVVTGKMIGDTQELLEGVTLRIERLTDGGWEAVDQWVTGRQRHYTKDLKEGSYRLVEIKAARGFKLLAEPIEFTITDGMTEVPQLTMRNYSTIVDVQKVKSGTQELLPGARLQLINENSGQIIREWTSEEAKGQTFYGLEPGNYILRETKAPQGYEIAPDMKLVIEENNHSIQVFRFENKGIPLPEGGGNNNPQPTIEFILFKKADAMGHVLEGAGFTFYDQEGNVTDTSVSDKEGRIRIRKPKDGTYTFKETKAPSGYAICPESYSFTVSGQNIIRGTYEIVDYEMQVNITKLDGATDRPLEGAELSIEQVSGEKQLVFQGATGTEGTLTFRPESPGTYRVHETKPPEGYAVNDAVYEFTVGENGQISGNTTLYNWRKEIPPKRIGKITAVYKVNVRFGKGFFHFGTELRQRVQTGDNLPIIAMITAALLCMAGFCLSIGKGETKKGRRWRKILACILVIMFVGVFFPCIAMAMQGGGEGKTTEIRKSYNDTVYVSDVITYPEMEGISPVPQSAWIWSYDGQTRRGRRVLLPLKEYHFSNERWIDGFRLDVAVTDYGADCYLLGDELVEGMGEPHLSGQEKNILYQAGLNEEAYKIDLLQWKGAPYKKDGVICRDLTASGRKLVADCNATYAGEVNPILFSDQDTVMGTGADRATDAGGPHEDGKGGEDPGNIGGNDAGKTGWYAVSILLFIFMLVFTVFIMKKSGRRAPRLLSAVFLTGFIVSAGWLLKTNGAYKESRDYYSALREMAYGDEEEAPVTWVTSPAIDEAVLGQSNPEYKCWLSVPGTAIEYPVVQHKDNQYYLTHNFNREEQMSGSIFADSTTVPLAADNTIIYGHNMRDGSMFGTLKKYMDKSFFKQNPCIRIFSHGSWKEYPVFSCQLRSENDAGAYRTNLLKEEWVQYLNEMKDMSLYETGIVPKGNEQVITLSTCIRKNQRLIVQALVNGN